MELASWEFFAMEFLRIVPRYHLSKFLQAWKKLVVQLFYYVFITIEQPKLIRNIRV